MWHFFKHRVFSFKFENVSITYENKNEEWDIYSDSDNNKSNKNTSNRYWNVNQRILLI